MYEEIVKLINSGADITKEALHYANDMQAQINELNREALNDHNRKIANLQTEHDIIVDMLKNKELSYDEKMKLLEKMEDLQNRINKIIEDKDKLEKQEKEKITAEKKKAGQVVLEVATGIIPFTTAYRAIKKKKSNNTRTINQVEAIENSETKLIENEDKSE